MTQANFLTTWWCLGLQNLYVFLPNRAKQDNTHCDVTFCHGRDYLFKAKWEISCQSVVLPTWLLRWQADESACLMWYRCSCAERHHGDGLRVISQVFLIIAETSYQSNFNLIWDTQQSLLSHNYTEIHSKCAMLLFCNMPSRFWDIFVVAYLEAVWGIV